MDTLTTVGLAWIVGNFLVILFNYCASVVSGNHEDSHRDEGQ